MPYDSSGLFSLVPSYKAVSGQTIRTESHNPPLEDIASGMSSVMVRDGRAGMVGNLPMGGFKTVNMGDGTDPTDGATVGQLGTAFGSQVGAATSKATPVDADYLPLYDSAAANALRKLTWANVKATLKTYFDTLYAGASAALLKAGGTMTGDLILKGNPTSNLMAATKQYVDAVPVQKVYESPEQAISAGGRITLTHALGAKPKFINTSLVCKIAEQGFAVGEEIMSYFCFGINDRGVLVSATTTQVFVQYRNQPSVFQALASGGGAITLTNDSWRLIVRAYA